MNDLQPIYPDILTADTFVSFGHVIDGANPSFGGHSGAISTNQGTAIKAPAISPITNEYHTAPAIKSANPTMSLFTCFPRPLATVDDSQLVKVTLLEQHPYTTQTFIPMGLEGDDRNTWYLVVVAPALENDTGPDTSKVKAFRARGSQAVTYGVGTWHSPMMVIGQNCVNFVVVQYVNGVGTDDCVECVINEITVRVD